MSEWIAFDSVIGKLIGEKAALRLGLAVRVVEGPEVSKGISGPEGRSQEERRDSSSSVSRGSAGEASKTATGGDPMREEWERFRSGRND